ncbi:hypothetical protein [Yoonia sp.]|uniref:hypothetical protein n=1 Tax=Yoonia sp. TaxID=2212373 RepID=UPI0035C79842
MTDLQKSEIVIARILSLLVDWGIQETELRFSELELDDSFAPFFFPCVEWLQSEQIIRVSRLVKAIDGPGSGVVLRPVLTSEGFAILGKKITVDGEPEVLSNVIEKVGSSDRSLWQFGDAIGGILGGFTKSMGN